MTAARGRWGWLRQDSHGVLFHGRGDCGHDAAVATNEAAVEVWLAARKAQGSEPSPDRVRRVRGKLSDPRSFLVVLDRADATVGMALAEPYRSADGFGQVEDGHGHISMLFVDPGEQGAGIGTELLQRIIDEAPFSSLSLWTQDSRTPAETLRRLGFRATSDRRTTAAGARSQRWERVEARRLRAGQDSRSGSAAT